MTQVVSARLVNRKKYADSIPVTDKNYCISAIILPNSNKRLEWASYIPINIIESNNLQSFTTSLINYYNCNHAYSYGTARFKLDAREHCTRV